MKPPKLTPEIIVDDEPLSEAIDEFVKASSVLKLRARSLQGREAALKGAVDDNHWTAVLALDEARVEHLQAVLIEIVRWAYREGAKRRGSP